MTYTITPPLTPLSHSIQLPTSKSESNRALIIRALSHGMAEVTHLSNAKDTQTLDRLLREMPEEMDVGHAGTTMRFLTAYLSFLPRDFILTGSSRMQQRPIGPLVDALRLIGAEINYMRNDGYPPLMINGRNAKFGDTEVEIPGGISSQYISALLMLAPVLPDGLTIHLTGPIRSRSYIEMTLALMAHFGVEHHWNGASIRVAKQHYRSGTYQVESDWSAASYWYSMVAMSDVGARVELPGLRENSWQGDQAVVALMAHLGVDTTYTETGLILEKTDRPPVDLLEWDFKSCPDLAQGVLVPMAVLGVAGRFRGLESLRIKETDRIAALQAELGKFGVELEENEDADGKWWRLGGHFTAGEATIPTYDDHRMAMAFAPLALATDQIHIEEPEVVVKSYPHYWEDLKKVGFGVGAISQ